MDKMHCVYEPMYCIQYIVYVMSMYSFFHIVFN